MNIVCLDMEGVLVPEIWIAFSEASGIPELKRTTRYEPDYDKLISSLALSGEKERIFDFVYSNEPYKTWSVLDIKEIEEFLPKAEGVAKAIMKNGG